MGNYMSCSCSSACINACSHVAVGSVSKRKQLLKMIMVVHFVEGRVMEIGGGAPMTVAELMLEFPGHFVSEYEMGIPATHEATHEDIAGGMAMKRASPLPADHEASPGRIYILFPMHRLHTRVPPQESTLLNTCINSHLAANSPSNKKKKAQKHAHHHLHGLQASSKVTPLNGTHSPPRQEESPADDDQICPSDEEIDSFLQQFCSSQQQKAGSFKMSSSCLVRSKSWIPKLETISESSILSA